LPDLGEQNMETLNFEQSSHLELKPVQTPPKAKHLSRLCFLLRINNVLFFSFSQYYHLSILCVRHVTVQRKLANTILKAFSPTSYLQSWAFEGTRGEIWGKANDVCRNSRKRLHK
jgi:hypothetical protein